MKEGSGAAVECKSAGKTTPPPSAGSPPFNGRRLGLISLLFIGAIVFILLHGSNQKHTHGVNARLPQIPPPRKKKKLLKEPVFNSANVKAGLAAAGAAGAEPPRRRADSFRSLYTRVFPYEAIRLQRKHTFNPLSLPPHHSCIFMFLCFH